MHGFISQFAGFLWSVLCHSLWSVPLIGLLFGIRIESLSPSRGEKRMRFAILASIAAPFAIVLALPAVSTSSSIITEPHFENPAISSRVMRDLASFGSRPSFISSVPDVKNEPPHMLSLESIVSESVIWSIRLWFAGMAVLSGRLIAGNLLIRIRHRFELGDSNSQSIANDLADRMRLRNPPAVRISDTVTQPMVMGVFRPEIILPRRWAIESGEDQLEAVLAHELAHIRRRDLVNLLIERIAGIVWFFHPAMHRMNRQAALWREMAADRLATEVTGDPLALAQALESVATWAAGIPRFSPFESFAITFASPRCRGRLGMRIKALLGPEGVCPVKISKKMRVSCFIVSVSFAVMATKLAAIGQEIRTTENQQPNKPKPAVTDTFVEKAERIADQPAARKNWVGRMNRISSKSRRESNEPAQNPQRSFEVRLVSVSGNDLEGFLNEKSESIRTADDRNAWIVDKEPVLKAATSFRRNLIHQAPMISAADGEPLNFTFTLPVTTVKYHPVQKDGKVRSIKPVPQTTDYDIYARIKGFSGTRSTIIEIAGLETMPKSIEKVVSPIQVERPSLPPHGVVETVVSSQSDPFEATAEVPYGKSLIIKLGRTIEEIDDNLFTAAFQLANPKLWNQNVYPFKAMQRYLIVTPTDLP